MNRHRDYSFREMSATREDTISDTEDQENYLYALNDVPGILPPSLDADLIESDHPRTRNDCNFGNNDPVVVVNYPGDCAKKYGVCENRWDIMLEKEGMEWGGFADEDEWELARWLLKSRASQRDIDEFAKLPIVSKPADQNVIIHVHVIYGR